MTHAVNAGNSCDHLAVEDVQVVHPYLHMYQLQTALQDRLGVLPTGDYKVRAGKIIFWAHCISDEFFELTEWFENSNQKFSLKEVQMEFIDIWHFVFNIGLELGVIGQDIQTGLTDYKWAVAPAIDPFRLVQYSIVTRQRIHRLLDPLPWKTWKKYADYQFTEETYNKVCSEFVELLKHLLLLAGELGMDLKLITNMYVAKNRENHARQDRGY